MEGKDNGKNKQGNAPKWGWRPKLEFGDEKLLRKYIGGDNHGVMINSRFTTQVLQFTTPGDFPITSTSIANSGSKKKKKPNKKQGRAAPGSEDRYIFPNYANGHDFFFQGDSNNARKQP